MSDLKPIKDKSEYTQEIVIKVTSNMTLVCLIYKFRGNTIAKLYLDLLR